MRYVEGVSNFFSKHNDIGNSLYKSISSNIEKSDFFIRKHGDYKFSTEFRGEEIEINRFPSNSYSLTISNVRYDVSSWICKKIWSVLEKNYDKKKFRSSDIKKKFEMVTGDSYIDGLGKDKSDSKADTNKEIISEFNKKKGTIDSIFSKKDLEDGEVDDMILKDVFGGESKLQNPISKGYVSFKRTERSVDMAEESLTSLQNEIKEMNQKISDLNSKSSKNPDMSDYYNNQIVNQKKSIETANNSISDKKKKIQDLKKRVSEERKEFKLTISRFI